MQHKDPAIRLFGQKIPRPVDGDDRIISAGLFQYGNSDGRGGIEESQVTEKTEKATKEDDVPTLDVEEPDAEGNENPKTPSIDEKEGKPKMGKAEKKHNDSTNSQEKPLKKPDKKLPCPRCNSMDTKFCYYNNYNVNQPRHFCKACQRYWTAGGTMRNVPVGAGRRKNKNSSSHYSHITISEALQAVRVEASSGLHHPALNNNGRVLSFAFDSPICNSVAPVLSLREKKLPNRTRNGLHNNLQGKVVSVPCRSENGDDCSSGSSVTVSNSMEEGGRKCVTEPGMRNINGFPSQIPCLAGAPWPHPWQSAASPPVLCPTGFPMQFYPTAFWNCGLSGAWNVPLLSPQSSSDHRSPNSDPSPPSLGKHSREDNQEHLETEKPRKQKNGNVLVPKALRIDDPTESGRSSIWATLGIKNESLGVGGMFKGVKSKDGEKNCVAEASPILHANPAALCRSQNFHEST